MALSRLEAMRAHIKQDDDRKSGATNRSGGQDKTIYPFWDIKENSSATLRFLPDGDQKNPVFWVERLMINLTFPGIKDEIGSKPCVVKVPCMEMYGEVDPIIAETRAWWDIPEYVEKARQYWKKRSYLFQGLVVVDGLGEKPEDIPENPIRRFIIGPQIQTIIKNFIMDPENKEDPTDYMSGIDFRINKTTKGKYADYASSTWSRNSRALSADEMNLINHYGLYNLSDFLPKKPTVAEQDIIREMFEASVNEEPFDMQKWGEHFKPVGSFDEESTTNGPKPAPAAATPSAQILKSVASAPAPAVSTPQIDSSTDDDSPFDTTTTTPAPTSGGGNRADQILKMIRNRDQ